MERLIEWVLGKQDRVLLFMPLGNKVARVRWVLGRPFVTPYGPDSLAELMPDGTCDGLSFIRRWKALTPRIQEWARSQSAEPPEDAEE